MSSPVRVLIFTMTALNKSKNQVLLIVLVFKCQPRFYFISLFERKQFLNIKHFYFKLKHILNKNNSYFVYIKMYTVNHIDGNTRLLSCEYLGLSLDG